MKLNIKSNIVNPKEISEMKISILSTFYNDKKMMKLVMDSVLKQNCQEIEHVIVDAASTDGSVQLIKEYEKKYAQAGKELKWISEPDKGIYYGFNKAFELSSGDYIMVNAPDPFLDEFVFSDLTEVLTRESPDYVYGGVYYQKEGKIIRNWSGRPGNWRLGWMAATPTLCVKRKVMEKYGPFDTSNGAADYKFQLKLFRDSTLKSCAIERIIVVYFAGGTSNGGLKANLNSIKADLQALKECGVTFPWFVSFCKIIRAIFAYTFVSHKNLDLTVLQEQKIT